MKTPWTDEVVTMLQELLDAGDNDTIIAEKLTKQFGYPFSSLAIRSKRRRLGIIYDQSNPARTLQEQLEQFKMSKEKRMTKRQETSLLSELVKKETELELVAEIKKTPQDYKIRKTPSPRITATAFIIASDWHVEEEVKSEKVNDLNKFNLEVADERINRFFNNALTLYKQKESNLPIDRVVLALLGDFISGDIHEELMANCQLRPMEAIVWVQERLIAGVKFLIDSIDKEFIIVCHVGNHSRSTKRVHHSNEQGNSCEYFMYHNLQWIFRENKNVTFIIAEGYHTYLSIYDYTIRFHHGHNIQYNGGMGGPTISLNKAIGNWNEARYAHLDVLGHFHSMMNTGKAIINGSLIGYSPYAISIKVKMEKPRQKFFLYTSKGEVIEECPIFLDS